MKPNHGSSNAYLVNFFTYFGSAMVTISGGSFCVTVGVLHPRLRYTFMRPFDRLETWGQVRAEMVLGFDYVIRLPAKGAALRRWHLRV